MFSKRTWTDVLFAVVLPAAVIGGVYYFGFRDEPVSEGASLPGAEAHARGARVKEALRILETIQFSQAGAMLNSPVFNSLTDFTVPIGQETFGRENPFTRPPVVQRLHDLNPNKTVPTGGTATTPSPSTNTKIDQLNNAGSVRR
ncbi:MAG TPA: hypothetical protein VLB83_01895 [Candidatus Paceibacterota bacterium]|nr:hypothetical protein [Candidatus Paceibacterota bacterium]